MLLDYVWSKSIDSAVLSGDEGNYIFFNPENYPNQAPVKTPQTAANSESERVNLIFF